ncbi:hypothetical protein NDU88_002429 [Pleurodeles waltl]|uniref:Uncharacterized protein n=1 Tax=Pleurodeles waltl TaxID=8319 RepID=A0AAV7TN77_PLEWA|nr:hypothetical protein NDU88_002429 [Pleurodeles waltl]
MTRQLGLSKGDVGAGSRSIEGSLEVTEARTEQGAAGRPGREASVCAAEPTGRRRQRVESRASCPRHLARARSEGRSGRPPPPHDRAVRRPSAAGSEKLRRPEPRSSGTAELPTGGGTYWRVRSGKTGGRLTASSNVSQLDLYTPHGTCRGRRST